MDARNRFEMASLLALRRLLRAMPRGASRGFLRALTGVAVRHPAGRREVVSRQLAAAYPDLDADGLAAMVAAVYDHLSRLVGEILLDDDRRPPRLAPHPGWQALDEALARGRGAILASAHLGNFEFGGRLLASRYRLLDVVKPQRNPAFDAYINGLRARHGIDTVAADRCGYRVVSHLRSGGVVSLLLDQDAGADGVAVPFMGRMASVWPGAARLALRTGSPVLPVGTVRQEDGSHLLHVGSPVAPPPDGEATAEFTARISRAVEDIIRLAPTQWFWVHRRWKGAAAARTGWERHGRDQAFS